MQKAFELLVFNWKLLPNPCQLPFNNNHALQHRGRKKTNNSSDEPANKKQIIHCLLVMDSVWFALMSYFVIFSMAGFLLTLSSMAFVIFFYQLRRFGKIGLIWGEKSRLQKVNSIEFIVTHQNQKSRESRKCWAFFGYKISSRNSTQRVAAVV